MKPSLVFGLECVGPLKVLRGCFCRLLKMFCGFITRLDAPPQEHQAVSNRGEAWQQCGLKPSTEREREKVGERRGLHLNSLGPCQLDCNATQFNEMCVRNTCVKLSRRRGTTVWVIAWGGSSMGGCPWCPFAPSLSYDPSHPPPCPAHRNRVGKVFHNSKPLFSSVKIWKSDFVNICFF